MYTYAAMSEGTVLAEADDRRAPGLKMALILFVIVIVVLSDVFVNSVIAKIGNTVIGRTPTSWGSVVQGVCIVLLYLLAQYLVERKIR